jgi:hypothetical protein
MAELTLPWVAEASRASGTEWDRTHRIKRVLRGCGHSPGFVEDWKLAGALSSEDITEMVELVTNKQVVNLAHLCGFCRQYQGPAIEERRMGGWAA